MAVMITRDWLSDVAVSAPFVSRFDILAIVLHLKTRENVNTIPCSEIIHICPWRMHDTQDRKERKKRNEKGKCKKKLASEWVSGWGAKERESEKERAESRKSQWDRERGKGPSNSGMELLQPDSRDKWRVAEDARLIFARSQFRRELYNPVGENDCCECLHADRQTGSVYLWEIDCWHRSCWWWRNSCVDSTGTELWDGSKGTSKPPRRG